MKSYLKILSIALAAIVASVSAFSAESSPAASDAAAASPAGTWKWSQPGRDGANFEQTLKLEYKDGELTGTLLGGQRGDFQIPDVAITDASFKDNTISFSVTREFNGTKIVSKYEGIVQGDTIKGSSERPGRNGAPRKSDWNAARS